MQSYNQTPMIVVLMRIAA